MKSRISTACITIGLPFWCYCLRFPITIQAADKVQRAPLNGLKSPPSIQACRLAKQKAAASDPNRTRHLLSKLLPPQRASLPPKATESSEDDSYEDTLMLSQMMRF